MEIIIRMKSECEDIREKYQITIATENLCHTITENTKKY